MAAIAIVLLSLLLVASNGYFLFLRPEQRRRLLLAAVPRLHSEARADLEAAEEMLATALASGLGRADTRDARFALAWVRTRLGAFDPTRYADALATLGAAGSTGRDDPAVLHLRLWLLSRLGRHDEVLAVADTSGGQAHDRDASRTLCAAALQHRAVQCWSRRDVDAAVRHLDEARALDPDAQVPAPELVELLIESGMRAVTDAAYGRARISFTQARELAPAESSQRIEAVLGLLVCQWHSDGRHTVVPPLTEVFDELLRRQARRGADADDERLLRTHVGWWLLVAMLESWLVELPAGRPPPDYERFLNVVRAAEDADPELGVVTMIHGLVDYGLATTKGQYARAVATVDRSTRTAKGVTLPDVLGLLARERDRERAAAGPIHPDRAAAHPAAAHPAAAEWAAAADWGRPPVDAAAAPFPTPGGTRQARRLTAEAMLDRVQRRAAGDPRLTGRVSAAEQALREAVAQLRSLMLEEDGGRDDGR